MTMNPEPHSLRVYEKFVSIQGESTHAGRLCCFIRLAGCNLDCSYCDTRYARDFDSGAEETLENIVAFALSSGIRLVEITGGEPLAQRHCPELCSLLLEHGFEVLVETNGSLDISPLPRGTKVIIDCKSPSSGMAGMMLEENYRRLRPDDEVKFVLSGREDYEHALGVISKFSLEGKCANLVFSAVWGSLDSATLAGWMIADRVPARMQLQMHKYVWGPEQHGV